MMKRVKRVWRQQIRRKMTKLMRRMMTKLMRSRRSRRKRIFALVMSALLTRSVMRSWRISGSLLRKLGGGIWICALMAIG